MITIYHNPRCSKSREALTLLQDIASRSQFEVTVVEYLKTPLTLEQLSSLQRLLGCTAAEMVRSNEEEYAALQLTQADEAGLLHALASHPKLLQRPIVVRDSRGVIARPPERVRELF
ncbi:MAG TPA: arsenate reductase (glutaredoxin) [Noviherbaspirillum sp.]|uniref:arsenate reductase (glutaredoxin) n=1 Tax=Noviherbaspirillum sp. TaxID=1926288 RepID=UPI002D63DD3B|nr:arsenate reductase (glutaredoxin) [Noviherbaspirillum sp.]HYD95027.1 arsenate reductase (glutaredoxin) [Noviherbaspirillum sp.]